MTTLIDHKLPSDSDKAALRERAKRLGLHGLCARLTDFEREPWLKTVLDCEDDERQRRSLERRTKNARLGRFKLLADFDWAWPKSIDRERIEEIFDLSFLEDGTNVVFIGPNGVGKTMLAQNLAHQAVLRGHTARYATASELLNELAAQESRQALCRRLQRLTRPKLLIVDEVGYLSYDSRHADLLFEIVSRRHGHRSTVITTNRPFKEWGAVFPNATSVVALVDRLVHKAEIVEIDAESYRKKEAEEREQRLLQERAARRSAKKKNPRPS